MSSASYDFSLLQELNDAYSSSDSHSQEKFVYFTYFNPQQSAINNWNLEDKVHILFCNTTGSNTGVLMVLVCPLNKS